MKQKTPINVYWAPLIINELDHSDWSFLYPKPDQLFSSLVKNRVSGSGNNNFFSCPAVSNKFKKTLVFDFPLQSKYSYDFTGDNKKIQLVKENSIGINGFRDPAINDGPCITLNLSYMFFAEEPVDAVFSAPYFHKPQYTNYGSPVPGEFNIGNWFRAYNLELQMWSNKGEFTIEENEPAFYTEFKTDRPIELKRFSMNEKLFNYANSCVETTNMFGRGRSLLQRYAMFEKVGLREKVLTEINKNLIDEPAFIL
jgi:hypothetical protein